MRRSGLVLLAAALALTGCHRRHHSARKPPRGDVVVTRVVDGQVGQDVFATMQARAIDAAFGAACPKEIRLGDEAAPEDRETIARACVGYAAKIADTGEFARASPWGRGLVAYGAIAGIEDADAREADAVSLRSIARRAFADGIDAVDAIDAPESLDADDTTKDAIAFALVEVLLRREGVKPATVIRLASEAANGRLDAALEEAPIHTDVITLFSTARAEILAFKAPRSPKLADARFVAEGNGVLLVQFDRPIREDFVSIGAPRPVEAFVCGVRTEPTFDTRDRLRFPCDPSRCEEVDGAPMIEFSIAPTPSESPRGLDGALVHRSYARVTLAPPDDGSTGNSPAGSTSTSASAAPPPPADDVNNPP